MTNVSRRNFLGMASAAAAAAPMRLSAQQDQMGAIASHESMQEAPALPPQPGEQNFVPDLTLEVAWKIMTIDGLKVKVRAYNGQIPGPLITTTAGTTLKIRVKNLLTPYTSPGWTGDMNVPHKLDHTNLHLHGLDIAPHIFEPLGTSDCGAPMISIGPGEYKDYPFVIPSDQSPGLNWYHPHSHGSTAVQAVSGMAGGLLIKGAIDEVPEIKAAKDYLIVLQDIGLFQPNKPSPDYALSYEPEQNSIWQTLPAPGGNVTNMGKATTQTCGFTTGDYDRRYYLINGQPFYKEEHNPKNPTSPLGQQMDPPVYKMRPGEVARFRLLNGCSDLMMPIQVEEHTMYLIALDGNNFDYPWPKLYQQNAPQVVLGSANRAEFLIKASAAPGRYKILQLMQQQQFLEASQKTLAIIEVAGDPVDMHLPHNLPPITRDPPITDADIVRKRTFIFSGLFPPQNNPIVGIDFRINSQLYDEFAVPTACFLNTCEEWTIMVPDAARGGTEGHPFHIHVNDFEVVSIAGIKPPHRLIMDTIWVQQDTATVIRMRFKQWTGKAVFHCHILPHEDTGMMQNFVILPEMPMHRHERSISLLKS